jgi:hypothetical protein
MIQSLKAAASASAKIQTDAGPAVRIRSLALCYGAVGCQHALASIAHLSCTSYLHADILEMHCPARDADAAITAAASSPGVYWIEPKNTISTRNWSGKSIIGTGSTQTFTSASAANPSKVFSTISVQNSVIGVADSGVSINNCYFCSLVGGASSVSSPSARFGIDRILSGACAASTGSTSARNIKKWPLLLPVLPCNLILCTCTGSWAKRTAPSAAAAAQQLLARRRLRHVATITMKMGKPYPPSYPPPPPSLSSLPHPPPRHGSHVAGQPDSTCFRTNTRTYSHVVCTSGTIAGSTNLAVDSNPSSFRNNGVAGASVLGATARGAQLFFQVFQQRDGIRAVHDASPGHSKQSDRCRLRLGGTWQKMCTARKCFGLSFFGGITLVCRW